MGHLADEAQCCVARQPGVGIEGNDVTHVRRDLWRALRNRYEGRVGGTAQQPVEFMQLAAFALPSHPFIFAGVEDAAPMQQQETASAGGRSVAVVQFCYRRRGHREQRCIVIQYLLIRVDSVQQESEREIATGAGEVVNLQLFNLRQQLRCAGQQRRHHYQRSQRLRNASREFKPRQGDCAKIPSDGTVNERGRHLGRREKREQHKRRKPADG